MNDKEKEGTDEAELGPDDKKIEVEATATVSDADGPTHEVEVEATATVTDLRSQETTDEPVCVECGQPTYNNRCANADCSVAQSQASKDATRDTAKVAVASAPSGRQSFGATGRPD